MTSYFAPGCALLCSSPSAALPMGSVLRLAQPQMLSSPPRLFPWHALSLSESLPPLQKALAARRSAEGAGTSAPIADERSADHTQVSIDCFARLCRRLSLDFDDLWTPATPVHVLSGRCGSEGCYYGRSCACVAARVSGGFYRQNTLHWCLSEQHHASVVTQLSANLR